MRFKYDTRKNISILLTERIKMYKYRKPLNHLSTSSEKTIFHYRINSYVLPIKHTQQSKILRSKQKKQATQR